MDFYYNIKSRCRGLPAMSYDLEEKILQDIEDDNLEKLKEHLKTKIISINSILLSRKIEFETNSVSILSHACSYGSIRIVKFLIDQKVQLDQSLFIRHKKTALHWAVSYEKFECVKLLIKAGADVNALDINKMTPLVLCHNHKNADICKYLIEYGADVNIYDRFNRSALDYALMMNNHQVATELIRHVASFGTNIGFSSVINLKSLVKRKFFKLAKMVVESGAYLESDVQWILSETQQKEQHQTPLDKDEESFMLWLKCQFTNPRSLLNSCRLTIRDLLKNQYLERKVNSLPLPKMLQDYLMMRH